MMTPWGWVPDYGGGLGSYDPLSGFVYGGSDPYGTNPDYQPGQLPPLDPSGNPIWINLPPSVGTIDIGGGTGRIPSVGTGGAPPNTGIGSTGTTPHGPYPAKPGGGGGLVHWLAGLGKVPGLGPIPSGVSAGAQASAGGASTGSAVSTGLETFAMNLLGRMGQQGGQGGGGGGRSADAARGGGGPVPTPLPPPQMSTLPPIVNFAPAIRPPGSSFQFGGTTAAPGLYQMEANETVRNPQQEQQLQQLLASSMGAPASQLPAGQVSDAQGTTQTPQQQPSQAGMVFQGGGGSLPQAPQPPQFGDPNAFYRLPGVPEGGVTPEQAAGPSRYLPTIPHAPYQQAFMSPGARTAYTVHNVLSDVSQGFALYKQRQWDKQVQEAQAAAMGQIQKQMKVRQQGATQPGQQQQQPDEVMQSLQKQMAESTDPKQRERLQKLLQQYAKQQEREDAQWAKIQVKAQDPTTAQYVGVQRAYAMTRAYGEQALQDDLLKARAQGAWMQAMAQYTNAQMQQQQMQLLQQQQTQFQSDIGKITGQTSAPPQPTGQSGANVQKSAAAAGAPATNSTNPIDQMIADHPFDEGERATLLNGYRQTQLTLDPKYQWESVNTVLKDRYAEGKEDPKASTIDWDDNSPTHWSQTLRNSRGEALKDKRTGLPLMHTGAPPPRGTETATLHYYHWTDSKGQLQEQPFYSIKDIPIDPRTGKLAVGPTGAPATRGGTPAITTGPATGGRQISKGGPGPTATPTYKQPPGTLPRPEQAVSTLPPGTRTLGQAKTPKMMGGVLLGGAEIAGTPAELEAVGVPTNTIHEVDAKDLGMINAGRSMLQPIEPGAPRPQDAPKGYIPRGGLFNQALYVLDQFKPGELGFLNQRWNELITGTQLPGVQAIADPRYVALRTLTSKLISTAMLQAHGAGKGRWLVSDFKDIADAQKMSPETLRQALMTEKTYIESRAENPDIALVDDQGNPYEVPMNELLVYMSKHKNRWVVK